MDWQKVIAHLRQGAADATNYEWDRNNVHAISGRAAKIVLETMANALAAGLAKDDQSSR